MEDAECKWSGCDERESGLPSSSSLFDTTDDGRLARERVEADELGLLEARPVLIAEALGRPAEVIEARVDGGREVRAETFGRGAGVGVDSGEGVGDGARRSKA